MPHRRGDSQSQVFVWMRNRARRASVAAWLVVLVPAAGPAAARADALEPSVTLLSASPTAYVYGVQASVTAKGA
jgi:hypothetical protein